MYIHKHWHLALPLGLTMTGFYILEYYKQRGLRTWDVDVMFLVFQFFAVTVHIGMMVSGDLYQRYMTDTDAVQVIPAKKEPEQLYPSTPLKYGEMHQYTQTFQTVTQRKDKQFAKTLLAMRASNENHVDLREDRWKSHFGSRENYIQVRSRFEQAGGFARKDARRNSPYRVSDWRVVELVAQGETLR